MEMKDVRYEMNDDDYEDKCESYFKSQYWRRINLLRDKSVFKPYHLPIDFSDDTAETDFFGYLLNDDNFYVSTLPFKDFLEGRPYYSWCAFALIWEVSAVHADKLRDLYMGWNIFSGKDALVESLSKVLNGTFIEERGSPGWTFESLYEHLKQQEEDEPSASWICGRIAELRQELNKSDLGAYWSKQRDHQPPPLLSGLRSFLDRHRDQFIDKYLKSATRRISNSNFSLQYLAGQSNRQLDLTDEVQEDIILFSTGGTGKTRQILNTLCHRIGVYWIAPNVESELSISPLLPHRAGASVDTLSMYRIFSELQPHGTIDRIDCFSLLYPRTLVFMRFQGMFPQVHNICPHWTLLQISCSAGFDIFDAVWRYIRLYPYPYQLTNIIDSSWQDGFDLWCIDEAQISFEDHVASSILAGIHFAVKLWPKKGYRQDPARPLVLSGTSLELHKAMAFMEHATRFWVDSYSGEHRARTISISEIIANEDDFWNVFRCHIDEIIGEQRARRGSISISKPLLCLAGRSLDFTFDPPEKIVTDMWDITQVSNGANSSDRIRELHSQISRKALRFSGRYRWSTYFIQELLRKCVESKGQLSPDLVILAANVAEQRVKSALRNQLKRMNDSRLREKLFRLAVRADVYCQATIFPENASCKLISEGFALVKQVSSNESENASQHMSLDSSKENEIVTGSLCEPLAVATVMDYLHKNREKYDEFIDGLFADVTVDDKDQGSLGKHAEYALAAKIDHFLRPSKDLISANRSSHFRRVLEGAKRLLRIEASLHTGLREDTYELCKNEVRYSNHQLHECPYDSFIHNPSIPENVLQWLEMERISEHNKLYFPPKDEGPDLMFVLKERDNKVLCVVQFKTGLDAHYKAPLREALDTFVNRNWYKQQTFRGQIIFIYVAPSVTIAEDTFDAAVKGLKDRAKESYFCYCGKEESDEVWGKAITGVLRIMKDKTKTAQNRKTAQKRKSKDDLYPYGSKRRNTWRHV